MKIGESWKARQQQQYSQKSPVDVRREARTAPVFGDLVTYSKGDGGVLGVFDSGVAPGFHVELVRFSRNFLSVLLKVSRSFPSQFSACGAPFFVVVSPFLFSAVCCYNFRARGIFLVRQFSHFSAVQEAPIFE